MRLASVRHATFGPAAESAIAPEVLVFGGERLAPFGVPVDRDRYLQGNGNSIAAMSMSLVDHYRPSGDLDLVISAHSTPDCDAYVSLTGLYARRYGTGTVVFAVSDLGRVAPFLALRLAHTFPVGRRALVIALDQSTVTYEDPALADLSTTTDHAVGLLLSPDGPVALPTLELLAAVPPEAVASTVAAQLAACVPDVVIAGPTAAGAVAECFDPATVRVGARDQLCTAVWSALAAELASATSGPRRVAVVEYEPALQYLCLAVFDVR